MSYRNFDAAFTKRIRDLNVAQNVQNAMNSGSRIGNPSTALNEVSLINQFRPGELTIIHRGNTVNEASINIGGGDAGSGASGGYGANGYVEITYYY
jgi:hypothetical protein